MSNVVTLPVITRLDTDPSQIVEKAAAAELTEVVIIGYSKDGSEYFASSIADGGSVLWHLERAKMKLLRIHEDE
jgi:predicted secreted protein